jgi:hypothetical protein
MSEADLLDIVSMRCGALVEFLGVLLPGKRPQWPPLRHYPACKTVPLPGDPPQSGLAPVGSMHNPFSSWTVKTKPISANGWYWLYRLQSSMCLFHILRAQIRVRPSLLVDVATVTAFSTYRRSCCRRRSIFALLLNFSLRLNKRQRDLQLRNLFRALRGSPVKLARGPQE